MNLRQQLRISRSTAHRGRINNHAELKSPYEKFAAALMATCQVDLSGWAVC